MRIDEVHKIFGKFPQMPQNLPNGNKINKFLIGVAITLVLGGVIYFIYKNREGKKDLEK
jgi:hypothetical protein